MVTALGTAFVSLVESGNVHFLDWHKEWKSDVASAKEIGMDKFLEDMDSTIKYLNGHLETWRKDVMEFREKYPIANVYTIKQCLVLQRYLYQCSQQKQIATPTEEVFTLLQCISNNVSTEKIKTCLFAIHADPQKSTERTKVDSDETNFTRFTMDEINKYMKMLQDDFDLDESVVLASLVAVDIAKEGEAIIWCKKMMKEGDEDKIEELREKAEEELKIQAENMIMYNASSIPYLF